MQIGVITNPNSRKNKGRRGRAARLQSILGDIGEVRETETVDSIKPVLREFLRKRARYWVADGGDGALHWMVRMGMEVLQEPEFRGADLPLTLPTKGGTIDFIANNVGIKGNAESLLATLRSAIERRHRVEEVEVDSMLIDGVRANDDGTTEEFRTWGFGCAAGGVGQRFFAKYYEQQDPNPRTIVKVIGSTLASFPVAFTPLRALPGMPEMLREYASDVFAPTRCKVTIDGMVLPQRELTAVHIASMSINFGNVLRFFNKADTDGVMHALVGSPSPMWLVRNLPRMHRGADFSGRNVVDRACREMVVEADGDDLLAPIIDGEHYRDLKKVTFKLGPRVRIPKLVSASN
ncbi:MAG TPA: diacylglycerol kinase family protein [Kofleriaceae bacterium]|nr:diacylglycerol kinase family protein [Kofleriaceae bacterium]